VRLYFPSENLNSCSECGWCDV